jgi:hypothetical protein
MRSSSIAIKLGRCWGLATTALLLVVGGCSGLTAPREEITLIKGTVKVKGKPLEGGGIMKFKAQLGDIKAPGPDVYIQRDGTYIGHALIGKNYVTLQPKKARGKVTKVDGELTVDVKPGRNTLDLDFD